MSVAYGVLNYPTPYLQAYQMWTGLFPVFIYSTFQALSYRRGKPTYRVTAKDQKNPLRRPAILAITPQLLLIIASLAAILYGFLNRPLSQFLLLNIAWAIWTIWTMSGICLAALTPITFAESRAEPQRFTTGAIIHNVIGLLLFICIFCLAAFMVMSRS
jgi:hypothetical protein